MRLKTVALVAGLLCGIGAATPGGAKERAAKPAAAAGDGMQIEGVVGELDATQVEKTLTEGRAELRKCYEDISGRLFYLGGKMEVKLLIAQTGKARSVAMLRSTVGSYEVERCVVSLMQKMAFPQPKGGDGELTFPVEFAARTPVQAWQSDKIADAVHKALPTWKSCQSKGRKPKAGEKSAGVASIRATLYVGPGGQVTSAGFSANDPIDDKVAGCLLDKVLALRLDDPLGKMAKVSYDLGAQHVGAGKSAGTEQASDEL